MKVVIRYFEILGDYGICHAASYQNAFGSAVNSFGTRAEAVEFATAHGCVVEVHDTDSLQRDGGI